MVGIGIAGCDGCGCDGSLPRWTPPPVPTCGDEEVFCEGLGVGLSTFSLFFNSSSFIEPCFNCPLENCPYSGLGEQAEMILDPGIGLGFLMVCDPSNFGAIDNWFLYGEDETDDCHLGDWSGIITFGFEEICARINNEFCNEAYPPGVIGMSTGSYAWAFLRVWKSGYAKLFIGKQCSTTGGGSVKADPTDPNVTVITAPSGTGTGMNISVGLYEMFLTCCGDTTLEASPLSVGTCTFGELLGCCDINLAQNYIRMNC